MKNLFTFILGLIIGALIMYFYCCKQEPIEMNPIKPHGVITQEEAVFLDKNWTEYRKMANDSAAGKPDNRSCWWSLEDMRNYLDYAESQAKDLDYTMNGVRVYLGVYGEEAGEDKAGYTTMFLAPTGIPIQPAGTSNFVARTGNGDIPGGDPLNDSTGGNPPPANYPQ